MFNKGHQMMTQQRSMVNPLTSKGDDAGGHLIDPLDVIEAWGLNYHLGSVLKHISRAGQKECEKTNLEKALFYLDRFLRNCTSATAEGYITKENIPVEKVAKDWRLNTSLEVVLMHLHLATRLTPTFHIESAQKYIHIRLKNLKIISQQNAFNENRQPVIKIGSHSGEISHVF